MWKPAPFELVGGFVVGFCVIVGLSAACGGSSLVECRLRAASALPVEPDELNLGDVRVLVQALHACQASPDAGLP